MVHLSLVFVKASLKYSFCECNQYSGRAMMGKYFGLEIRRQLLTSELFKCYAQPFPVQGVPQ